MNDEQAQQVVECLVGIGAELTAIRQELQRLNRAGPKPEEALTCHGCGAEVGSEAEAERHARDEHGAPEGAWSDLFA